MILVPIPLLAVAGAAAQILILVLLLVLNLVVLLGIVYAVALNVSVFELLLSDEGREWLRAPPGSGDTLLSPRRVHRLALARTRRWLRIKPAVRRR